MAVPFSNTKLRVPKGFQNILEGLAREILRTQPENSFEFGSKYFEQLLRVRDETGHDPAVHGARLEDRFYNNDSFKSPSVDTSSPQQQDAALTIQTNYRKHAADQEVASMKEEEAAEKIQAGFKGFQDRQKFAEMKEGDKKGEEEEEVDIDLNDPDVEKAAVKIQAGFKGFKARQEIKEKKSTDSVVNVEAEINQADDEIDIDLNDPEVEKAAIKIQGAFRKHITSSHDLAESAQPSTEPPNQPEEEEVDIDLDDPEVEKAAIKIQGAFRKHIASSHNLAESADQPSTSAEGEVKLEDQSGTSEPAQPSTEPSNQPEEEEVDIDLDDPDVADAAAKIQAGFKKHMMKKNK